MNTRMLNKNTRLSKPFPTVLIYIGSLSNVNTRMFNKVIRLSKPFPTVLTYLQCEYENV